MSVARGRASVPTAGVRPEAGGGSGGDSDIESAGRLRAYVESVLATERKRPESKAKPTAKPNPEPVSDASKPASKPASEVASEPASEVATSLFPMLSLDPTVLVPTDTPKHGRDDDDGAERKSAPKRTRVNMFDSILQSAMTKQWVGNNFRCLADLKTLYSAAKLAGPIGSGPNEDGIIDDDTPVARAMINYVNDGKNALGVAIGDTGTGFEDFEADLAAMTGVDDSFDGALEIHTDKLYAFLLRLMKILIIGGSTNAYFVAQKYQRKIDNLDSEVEETRSRWFPLNFALSSHGMEYEDPNHPTSNTEMRVPIEEFKRRVNGSEVGTNGELQLHAIVLLSHFLSSPQLKMFTTPENGSDLNAFGNALFAAAEKAMEDRGEDEEDEEEEESSWSLPLVSGAGFFSRYDYANNPLMYVAEDNGDAPQEEYVQYTTSDIFKGQEHWQQYQPRTSTRYVAR